MTTVILILLSLGTIIWTGTVLWQLSCRQDVGFRLVGTPLCPFSLEDIIPLFVAFGFWLISLFIWLKSEEKAPVSFFLLTASLLGTGELSSINSVLGGRPFTFLLAWLPPSLLHFHLQFLQQRPRRKDQITLFTLYGLAVILSLPPLLWPVYMLEQQIWFPIWRLGIRLSPFGGFALTILLLFRAYRQQIFFNIRRRIRFIALGASFAFAPLLLLSLLPNFLGSSVYVPYAFTFPWLLISPLTYVYIFFADLPDRNWIGLNHALVNYGLVVLLTAVYLAAIAILTRLSISLTDYWLLASALISIALLFIFTLLRQTLGQFVNWVRYGTENDHTDAIGKLSESLALALDKDTLQHLLLHDLADVMGLSHVALFLNEGTDTLSLSGDVGLDLDWATNLSLTGQITSFLQKTNQPLTSADLHRQITKPLLSSSEQKLLSLSSIALWLPLISGQIIQGLLLFGPKTSGELFSVNEKRSLTTLGFQAGSAAHNIKLVAEVRAKQHELTRAHRQLLTTQEQERQRLARWLHDSIVQQLLGITYQLAASHSQIKTTRQYDGQSTVTLTPGTEKIRQEILGVVTQLRQVTGDLRPAGLDELGLSAAIEGYVAHLEREQGVDIPLIELSLDPIEMILPEPVAICLFRAAQEGLRNALKHAQATHIKVSLTNRFSEITFKIYDNGQGFHVPARLSQLAWQNHFGLVGIAEQVHSIEGRFAIQSQPGTGTEILIQVPLLDEENDNDWQNSGVVGR